MYQLLELEGIGNARDLGGYRAGGKTVKKGLLLRTGALTKAAPDALLKLEKKNTTQPPRCYILSR